MRQRTGLLHEAAERTGIVAALLRGQATRAGYACYLRNLLPAYQALELALRRDDLPALAGLVHPALHRAESIQSDLSTLAGPSWSSTLPLLPAGQRYADRVVWAAQGGGARLIAHCYTRYLGDLSGGQVLGRRVAGLFVDCAPVLAFTRFTGIDDLPGFAAAFRGRLDQAAAQAGFSDLIVEEAATAFQLNIDVSNAVMDSIRPPDCRR